MDMLKKANLSKDEQHTNEKEVINILLKIYIV